jgi:ATP-dependent DNA helicase RecG
VDEQHRFGVMQRLELLSKSENSAADMLLMTATPIPRTLTQSIYGDLDISVISHKPSNRKPIITALKPKKNIKELLDSVARSVEKGEKIYWICPLIEEQEEEKNTSKTSVEERYKSLVSLIPEEKLDYLHGKMSEEEKNNKVENFKHSNSGRLLISTTVIEVGIDVPDAKIIVIEDAEKFGLAQLHQLRGRVGRGSEQSYCILLYDFASPIAMKRLLSLKETEDGFKIAELDLQLRGAGDVAGYKQSGLPDFKFFDWSMDKDLIKNSKILALEYIAHNGDLATEIMELFNKNSSSI